ncbi:IclR family transcriptional regulator [Ideonella azotifigens]|uniref:IclR family transcriptional regulator n=2 Tax=Ideonella azotifigens TaxID=513160 RepID=A0ABN1JKL0_9BURK
MGPALPNRLADLALLPASGLASVRPLMEPGMALPPTESRGTADIVTSLQQGLRVIEVFDQDRPQLTIAEVARRADLSRAAARRYLLTLAEMGYVKHDGKTFALSVKVLRLAQSFMHSSRLPRLLQPQLQAIAAALQESSSAGVLEGDDVISVAAAGSGRLTSSTLQPGTRVPAYCTANGRVLLAALSPEALDAWLRRQTLPARTTHTLVDHDALRAEVQRVRARGHALVDQEFELGLRTVAVPLRNFKGEVVASANLSAHASRMRMDELAERGLPLLLQLQAQLQSLI